jgi:hypothetical protein
MGTGSAAMFLAVGTASAFVAPGSRAEGCGAVLASGVLEARALRGKSTERRACGGGLVPADRMDFATEPCVLLMVPLPAAGVLLTTESAVVSKSASTTTLAGPIAAAGARLAEDAVGRAARPLAGEADTRVRFPAPGVPEGTPAVAAELLPAADPAAVVATRLRCLSLRSLRFDFATAKTTRACNRRRTYGVTKRRYATSFASTHNKQESTNGCTDNDADKSTRRQTRRCARACHCSTTDQR